MLAGVQRQCSLPKGFGGLEQTSLEGVVFEFALLCLAFRARSSGLFLGTCHGQTTKIKRDVHLCFSQFLFVLTSQSFVTLCRSFYQ